MMDFAVVATGPSLTLEQLEKIRGKFTVIVVNDAFNLAPWADYMVAQDIEWWAKHPEAHNFAGGKFSTNEIRGVTRLDRNGMISNSTNSGLVALELAKRLGAKRIVMLGFDMQGSHYFGAHPEGLHNSTPSRFKRFMQAFEVWRMMNRKLEVVNCTPDTALNVFKKQTLDNVMAAVDDDGEHVVINGMQGLGDNIYQRAFVANYPGCYVITPWPEIYEGLEVKCVKPETKLRTQGKNIRTTEYDWHELPRNYREIHVSYGRSAMVNNSIIGCMQECFGTEPIFTMPTFMDYKMRMDKPVAVIRPVTLRKEWMNSARSPDPQYISQAGDMLRQRGFHVISVADTEPGKEWIVGDMPIADEYLHNGELSTRELLSLVAQADIVVGGVGWIVPACAMYGTNAFIVLGGNGAHNAPSKILAPGMNSHGIGFAVPDNFCHCANNSHDCSKTITDFEGKLIEHLTRLGFSAPDEKRTGLAARNRHGLLPGEAGRYAL